MNETLQPCGELTLRPNFCLDDGTTLMSAPGGSMIVGFADGELSIGNEAPPTVMMHGHPTASARPTPPHAAATPATTGTIHAGLRAAAAP